MPSQRDLENKQRDDFHAGNAADLNMPLITRKAPAPFVEKEEKKKVKNFDVNYIDEKTFQVELAYLPIRPHSDLILVLGPRVENSSASALKLDEATANKLLDEKIKALGASFRVIAISSKLQNEQVMPGGIGYTVGDYVTFQSPLRLLTTVSPENEKLAYYEVRNMDVKYSMTAASVENFKPKTDEV